MNAILTESDAPPIRLECYNLFRNKLRQAILCAVPQDRCVPRFLNAERWTFERTLGAGEPWPPGFKIGAARTGVHFNGFHMFQLTGPERCQSPQLIGVEAAIHGSSA